MPSETNARRWSRFTHAHPAKADGQKRLNRYGIVCLLFGRNHHNSAVGDVVAAGLVLFGTEADYRALRHLHSVVKDRVADAAIPADLLEAELFGYEGGAFTGAVKSGRQGKFEMADKGSLFLDEINQLPVALQPKLLRVLQEREIDRIGGRNSLSVDVRVIAATNVALDKLVEEQKFRSDLFYRLNVMLINVPPLRERKEDFPQLIHELLNRLNRQLGVDIKGISPEVLKLLLRDEWPGNVRELQNVLERAMNIAWRGTLELEHFEWFIENRRKTTPVIANDYEGNNSLKDIKKSIEKVALEEALKSCGNNKTHAARKLKISRTMIYKKMHQLGL